MAARMVDGTVWVPVRPSPPQSAPVRPSPPQSAPVRPSPPQSAVPQALPVPVRLLLACRCSTRPQLAPLSRLPVGLSQFDPSLTRPATNPLGQIHWD